MVERAGIALPVREVAARAGTSTTAVYSLFGGKAGLQQAVVLHGYDDLATAQAAVAATDDPTVDIAGLGLAYLGWALEHPRLYEVLFGQSLVGIEPSPGPSSSASSARPTP